MFKICEEEELQQQYILCLILMNLRKVSATLGVAFTLPEFEPSQPYIRSIYMY